MKKTLMQTMVIASRAGNRGHHVRSIANRHAATPHVGGRNSIHRDCAAFADA